jgi:putative hydrolase of the HAD superfamily
MAGMNRYIARVLGDGVTPASDEVVNATRTMYWRATAPPCWAWSSTTA